MTVKEKAYAKINLYLDVLGRRDDGFHDVKTLMHTVTLFDDIILTAIPSDNISVKITSNNSELETNENNLIYKSAVKYMSFFDIKADIQVELLKRIPIGAGLGGGSADAAATLRAMNKMFNCATKEQLLFMAAEIGSDVPFLIDGGYAVCTGRGEKLQQLNNTINRNVVIAIGNDRVSTPHAYALLDEKYGDFSLHNEEMACLKQDNLPIYNIFESVICFSDIEKIKNLLAEKGAKNTLMSGSGPSVFGIFDSSDKAECAKSSLEALGFCAYRCETI